MDVPDIGKNVLKNVQTAESVPMESLWKNQACVLIFFRRWGCLFCRLWAKELSEMAPLLKENNVRLVGVGAEELGVQAFVDGKFFAGELYIDTEKKTYHELKFKRFSMLSVLMGLLTKESRTAVSKAKSLNLQGDFKGDGLQNGGALVVCAGGKQVLLNFQQNGPADHLPNIEILKVLGLEDKTPAQNSSESHIQPDCSKSPPTVENKQTNAAECTN